MSGFSLDPEKFPPPDGDPFRYVAAEAEPGDEAIPAGSYICRIVSAEDGHTEEKRTPRWKVDFEVIAGDHKGRHVFKTYVLAPKARPFFDRLMRATGRLPDDFDGRKPEVKALLEGAELVVTAGIENSSGQATARGIASVT